MYLLIFIVSFFYYVLIFIASFAKWIKTRWFVNIVSTPQENHLKLREIQYASQVS